MASQGRDPRPLVFALVGTGLVAAGASALNMVLERDTDARMLRTRNRPLAAGRMRPAEAVGFGLGLTTLGLAGWLSGPLSAAVAFSPGSVPLLPYTAQAAHVLSTPAGAGALPW
jgi:protoheme IX farnesyltransferase